MPKQLTVRFAKKAGLVVQSARDLTSLCVDVLKVGFPADMQFEQDKAVLCEACE